VPCLRVRGCALLLHHKPLWPAQGKLHFFVGLVRSRILESKLAVYDGPIRSCVGRKLTYCAVNKVAELSLCVCGAVSLFVKGRKFWNYDRRKGRQLQRYALE